MAEVEAQAVGAFRLTPLRHMIAKRAAQRLVQQVRRRMVGADLAAAGMADLQLGRLAFGNSAFGDRGRCG
jgi:hypothetical protein